MCRTNRQITETDREPYLFIYEMVKTIERITVIFYITLICFHRMNECDPRIQCNHCIQSGSMPSTFIILQNNIEKKQKSNNNDNNKKILMLKVDAHFFFFWIGHFTQGIIFIMIITCTP